MPDEAEEPEYKEKKLISMSNEEWFELMRQGTVELKCAVCGYEPPAGHPHQQTVDILDHLTTVHGYSEEQARNSEVKIGVHIYRCPRCEVRYKTEHDVEALSRLDSKTKICNMCATDEAFESMAGRLTPMDEWPKERAEIFPRPNVGWPNNQWESERGSNRSARTPVPTPRELPDLRLHLLERWMEGGIFEKQMVGLRFGQGGADWERDALRNASLWWIKDEMVELTAAAAKNIPHDIFAEEVKLPAEKQWGMAVLGAPFVGHDCVTGDEIHAHCIVWGKGVIETRGGKKAECISISMYRYFDFSGGLSGPALQDAVKTGAIWDAAADMVGSMALGQRVGHLRGGSWVYIGRTDWPLTDSLVSFRGFGDEEEDPQMTPLRRKSMIEDRAFFAALCLLVNHKLSAAEMIWSDRQTRRRSERHGVDDKREPSHVRYIRLREIRKKEGESDEEHEKRKVEYSHRWIVNGHVAWRRCGPKGSQRRLAYIPAYVKGPSDKPLVIKEDVRVWTR